MYLFSPPILSRGSELADKHKERRTGGIRTVPRRDAWGTPAGFYAEVGLSRLVLTKEKAPAHVVCCQGP
jgi:hypothetical protein